MPDLRSARGSAADFDVSPNDLRLRNSARENRMLERKVRDREDALVQVAAATAPQSFCDHG